VPTSIKQHVVGATPLFIAAQKGHLDVVRCLANDFGADVNQALQDGAMPLWIAVQSGHLDVV
jgi:ankyrin repeat protein